MKNIANRFYITLNYLLGISVTFAKPNPPEPNYKTPPPPPGVPIGEEILYILIIALIFGMYFIYNNKFKAKRLS
jgi:hypothetical protein